MNFIEDLGVHGNLQICKVGGDGIEEVLFDDHNTITSGMSVGLSYMFTGSGSTSITDFHLQKFQLGCSGPNETDPASAIYQLSGELATKADYGADSNLFLAEYKPLKAEANILAGSKEVFAEVPFNYVTRVDDKSVRYTLVLDENACNSANFTGINLNIPLTEIGLFMRNPTNGAEDNPLLVAYRTFTGITKTSDFSLIFRWTIDF